MLLIELAIILFVIGAALIVADLVLPSHGILSITGLLGILGGVVVCFVIGPWTGSAALGGTLAAGPLAWMWFVRVWPTTRMGRKMVLPGPATVPLLPLDVQIGQQGTCISELRPAGLCEFNGRRLEVVSQLGMVPAGTRVIVVELVNRRPVVRAAPGA